MADQLVTLAQVKQRVLPNGVTDTSEDPLLTELIEQATDYIQGETRCHFVETDGQTYVVDTAAGSVIRVPRGVRAITALGIASSDQPDTGGTYTAVTLADVLLRPMPIERRQGWPAFSILLKGSSVGRLGPFLNGAQLTGNFGFGNSVTTVPPLVQAIALDAVAAAYASRAAGDSGVAGPDASPIAVWARMFAPGTVQRSILDEYAAHALGIA